MKHVLIGTQISRNKQTEFSVTPSKNFIIDRVHVIDGILTAPNLTGSFTPDKNFDIKRSLDDLCVPLESIPVDEPEIADELVRLRRTIAVAARETLTITSDVPIMGLMLSGAFFEPDENCSFESFDP